MNRYQRLALRKFNKFLIFLIYLVMLFGIFAAVGTMEFNICTNGGIC